MATLIEINPYDKFRIAHIDGLTSIASGITSGMTLSDLQDLVFDYIQPLYFPAVDTYITDEFSSIIPNAVDGYLNTNIGDYDEGQMYFIEMMLDGIFRVPVYSIPALLANVNENIIQSGLNKIEQIPLLITIAIAAGDYMYWDAEISNPTSPWYVENFFDSNEYVNYLNLPYLVSSCIIGTLCSANMAKTYGQLDPPRIIGVDIVTALTGSLGVSTGKVIFKWLPNRTLGVVFGGNGGAPVPVARVKTPAGWLEEKEESSATGWRRVRYTHDWEYKRRPTRYVWDVQMLPDDGPNPGPP